MLYYKKKELVSHTTYYINDILQRNESRRKRKKFDTSFQRYNKIKILGEPKNNETNEIK